MLFWIQSLDDILGVRGGIFDVIGKNLNDQHRKWVTTLSELGSISQTYGRWKGWAVDGDWEWNVLVITLWMNDDKGMIVNKAVKISKLVDAEEIRSSQPIRLTSISNSVEGWDGVFPGYKHFNSFLKSNSI